MDFLRLQKLVETFNIGLFMENRKPQLAVCSYAFAVSRS